MSCRCYSCSVPSAVAELVFVRCMTPWQRAKLAVWFLLFGGFNVALALHHFKRGSFTLSVGKPPNQQVVRAISAQQDPHEFWAIVFGMSIIGLVTIGIAIWLLLRGSRQTVITPSRRLGPVERPACGSSPARTTWSGVTPQSPPRADRRRPACRAHTTPTADRKSPADWADTPARPASPPARRSAREQGRRCRIPEAKITGCRSSVFQFSKPYASEN